MTKEKIARINYLAKKSKETGLSKEEKAEQKMLRDEYRAEFRRSLEAQLKNIEIVEETTVTVTENTKEVPRS